MLRLLVTGIAGRLGRQLARGLQRAGHEVVGIDRRPWPGVPEGIVHHRTDLRRRPALEILESARIQAVVHLAQDADVLLGAETAHARHSSTTDELLRLCIATNVQKFVLISSGDVYGSHPSNSHFLGEDAPLLASQRYPHMRALVAVDRAVQSFFWRTPAVQTVILRPAHLVGPRLTNAASRYLRMPFLPTQLGFDPMLQLTGVRELRACLEASLTDEIRGVFNVASTQPAPLSVVLRTLGRTTIPVPQPLFARAVARLWRLGLTQFAPPQLEHLRFHTVLDTARAEAQLGLSPMVALEELLRPFQRHDVADAP